MPIQQSPPRITSWLRWPTSLPEDPRLHACALAFLSDMGPVEAVSASHPDAKGGYDESMLGFSLDHAVWFHRPVRVDDWVLIEFTGHGVLSSRGLATGQVFDRAGTHVATIAQEGLLRKRRA